MSDKPVRLTHLVKCAGCAAKLSPLVLREALSALPPVKHPNLLVGSDTLDDAGVYQIGPNLALINTTDFFPPIVDDPVLFGQIAAANAMSDVYAMGGEVLTALNIISFPKELPLDLLQGMLMGAAGKVEEAGAVTVGGHTVATDVIMFGLAVTGTVNPANMTTNAAAEAGDLVVLAKPLGTGIITTAIKQDALSNEGGQEAFFNMSQLNAGAARVMVKYGVKAATDVTGFGLLGHAMQLAQASHVTMEILANVVPIMDGAASLAAQGYVPGAIRNNVAYVERRMTVAGKQLGPIHTVLHDPQTSGGLLMCVKENKAEELVRDLIDAGYSQAIVVGKITAEGATPLVLKY